MLNYHDQASHDRIWPASLAWLIIYGDLGLEDLVVFSLAGRRRASRALGPLCILPSWNKSDQEEALDAGSGDNPASGLSSGFGLKLGLCPQHLGPRVGNPAGAEGGP